VPSKKIWVTEFGYDSMKVSDENQTKWLIEGMSIMHSFPEIEKIFVYRLYENDDGYGLVAPNYDEKLAFSAISNWLLSPSSLRPTAEISQERSSVQIQGALAVANGTDQFNIVVDVKDKDGKPVIDKKPSITVTGGQIRLSDFESKDGKWVAKVSSFEAGQKTAEIKVDKQVLGTANVFFSDTKQESVTQPRPQVSLPVVATSTPIIASVTPTIQSIPTNANTPSPKTATESSSTKTGLFWFLTIEIPIIAMIIIVLWIINKRRQAY
jgi:hypothetical protein